MRETGAQVVDERDHGLLLAFLLLGAEESALDALPEGRREVCDKAWRELRALDEAARATAVAAWRAEAASALPAGLSRLHPSWLEAALAGGRADVLAVLRASTYGPVRALVEELVKADQDASQAVEAGKEVPEETGRELRRLAFGWLAPLCESAAGPLAERLCKLEFDELLAEITRLGARTVGRSLAGAAPALRASAMASAGEPWAREIGAASLETVSRQERSAAVGLASGHAATEARTARERMLSIGLAGLKAELAAESPGSPFRVAGRLPAPLGRALVGW